MFFMYVYTEASDNVGGEAIPITITGFDRAACMNGRLDVMKSLVTAEGLDWDTVTSIEVETGSDHDEDGYPDADNPDTQTCYTRGGI